MFQCYQLNLIKCDHRPQIYYELSIVHYTPIIQRDKHLVFCVSGFQYLACTILHRRERFSGADVRVSKLFVQRPRPRGELFEYLMNNRNIEVIRLDLVSFDYLNCDLAPDFKRIIIPTATSCNLNLSAADRTSKTLKPSAVVG